MFLSKQYKIYVLWQSTKGVVTDIKLVDLEQVVSYKYTLYGLEYDGVFKQNIDKSLIVGNEIDLVYNKNNFELSLRKIPFQYEDYLMMLITIAGGLYLYFYSCENCECEIDSETMNSLTSQKVTSTKRTFE